MKKSSAAVIEFLDKREEVARKAGNKKLVDQIKNERAAFEEKFDMPQSLPSSLQKRVLAARTAMESAYATAVKDYTRTKQDDKAAAIELVLNEFKKGRPLNKNEPLRGDALRVGQVTPNPPAVLKLAERLEFPVEYSSESAEDVSIYAYPMYKGKRPSGCGYCPSAAYKRGTGTVSRWFLLKEAGDVDEILVNMTDKKTGKVVATISIPVEATWK